MNGQTPPKRRRPTRPDAHPTETPRPTRARRTKTASPPPAKDAASVPAAPSTAPMEANPAPIPVFAPAPMPDRLGDASPAFTPRQLAFMAMVAAVILAIIRRLVGRSRRNRG